MRRGWEGTLYHDTGGDWDTPTWAEIGGVQDVTLEVSNTEEDGTTRDSSGNQEFFPGLKVRSIEFDMIRKDTKPQSWDELIAAATGQTEVHVMALDGDKTTDVCEGQEAWYYVFDAGSEEPVGGGAVKRHFVLKPSADGANRPRYVEYAGGSTG